jgi:hypothetical protein
MLPPASLTMEKPTNPAAVAAPGPALEPDASAPEAQLGNEYGAGIVKTLHNTGILRGQAIAIWLGAVRSRYTGRCQGGPSRPTAMQWASVVSGGDLAVGLLGLRQGQLAGERDDAVQLGIEALQAVQIDACKAFRRELARFDPAGQLRHRSESDVLVSGRKGALRAGCADEAITSGPGLQSREHGIPARSGRDRRRREELPRSGARS